jgi:hypothetical protein
MLADIVALSTKQGTDVVGENLMQEITKLKIV